MVWIGGVLRNVIFLLFLPKVITLYNVYLQIDLEVISGPSCSELMMLLVNISLKL